MLELNKLEERLVSPVTVFMQIRELPSGQQQSVHGNVVNVPCDNIATLSSLPRLPENSDTIPLKLKRRLRYKTYVLYENVRRQACIEAVCYLLSKPLFQKYVPDGVNNNWIKRYDEQIENMKNTTEEIALEELQEDVFVDTISRDHSSKCYSLDTDTNLLKKDNRKSSNTDAMNEDTTENSLKQNLMNIQNPDINEENDAEENGKEIIEADDQTQDSDWSEDEDDDNNKLLGSSNTLLYPTTFDEYDGQHSFSVAPSEGNIPVPIFQDNLEELAYPTIFCGETRRKNKEREVKVKYSDICKAELRNRDRRIALNINNIFFKLKKLQTKQIQDRVWLSMKRCKSKGKTYTAEISSMEMQRKK